MLDFVMNLLIFFIITAVFVKEISLSVSRPQASNPNDPGKGGTIPVAITAQGDVLVENRVVDLRAVRANVERLYAVDPKKGVLIIADPDAPHGVMVQVVDQVHLGGIYNITFSTSK